MQIRTGKFDYFIGSVAIFAFLILLLEKSSLLAPYSSSIRVINIFIMGIFIADVVLRLALTSDRKGYIRSEWFNLIVFLPLIQFIHGIENTPSAVIIRQVVIITMLISRMKRAQSFFSLLHLKPAQVMIMGFMSAIGAGAVLLMLPVSTRDGMGMGFTDAVFTATSATCVTGLIVQDTAVYFTLFGKAVILCLIQLGGLGIMTFSVSLALLLGKQVGMGRQVAIQDLLDQETLMTAKNLTIFIIKMTLIIELIGAAVLYLLWKDRFGTFLTAAGHSVFHSVSAFCNAGFSTFSDSLMQFSRDLGVNMTIGMLIIAGGLGFPVIKDLLRKAWRFVLPGKGKPYNIRVQSRIVLSMSLILIISGAVMIYLFENGQAYGQIPMKGKVILSFFQSVTARTAGFNTCDIGSLSSASLFLIIILMFIGASPGSTGGGIKTTTFFVLYASMSSSLGRKNSTESYGRTIPYTASQKAFNLFILSIFIVILFGFLLLHFESKRFIDIIFETVSAFGTVGLSTGITPELTRAGKVLITLLMFIGRLGPLTIAYALLSYKRPSKCFYPEERILIG